MKKLFFIITTAVFFASNFAIAKNIDVIVAGKPGGETYANAEAITEFLKRQDFDVDVIDMLSPVKGLNYFAQTNKPSVMIFFDASFIEFPSQAINNDAVIGLNYASNFYLCGKDSNTDKINFSWRGDYPLQMQNAFADYFGKDVVKIPYDSSSAEVEGMMGGDTDYGLFSLKNVSKVEKINGVSCDYWTGLETDPVTGAQPLNTVMDSQHANLAMTCLILQKNIDNDTINIIASRFADQEYADFLTKDLKKTVFNTENWSIQDIQTFGYDSITYWQSAGQ